MEPLADLSPVFTREPGATWIGDQVRRAIAEEIDPVAEALLFIADHAAHLAKVVRPALAQGRPVISDRYLDSRYAYQAAMLEGAVPRPMDWLKQVHDAWTIVPDLTILLVLPVDLALARLGPGRKREHFEQPAFLERVQKNYLALAEEEPARFVLVEAEKEREEIIRFCSDLIRQTCESRRSHRRR
jgi:dTMP kinase